MLSFHDFIAWPVLAQAGLVGVGAAMSWRGLHLSGERGRLRLLWGALCLGSFLAALLIGAWADHDSTRALVDAQSDRRDALGKLQDIQGSLTSINGAMVKIADAAKVDPNQSAQALADQIIRRLSSLQEQISTTESRVATLEHPPHNPDSIYQGDKVVANFVSGQESFDHKIFRFNEIYNATDIDFSQPLYFRAFVLQCQPHGIDVGSSFSTRGMINNVMEGVMCNVISGGP